MGGLEIRVSESGHEVRQIPLAGDAGDAVSAGCGRFVAPAQDSLKERISGYLSCKGYKGPGEDEVLGVVTSLSYAREHCTICPYQLRDNEPAGPKHYCLNGNVVLEEPQVWPEDWRAALD